MDYRVILSFNPLMYEGSAVSDPVAINARPWIFSDADFVSPNGFTDCSETQTFRSSKLSDGC